MPQYNYIHFLCFYYSQLKTQLLIQNLLFNANSVRIIDYFPLFPPMV
ncbi:hypothetical protein CPS_1767 [Colwellia psychrerythraea 34H]|uniref:Uncharacterized protein n=1 Tax=Colwellia psychrerythraea (strain 34H / ATCC BAA-681) TaxID=167879 RepID=Q484L7_COLP3|nr:hypothetical protein CPS_1767 [Colwellia psychrerythraea 34H]